MLARATEWRGRLNRGATIKGVNGPSNANSSSSNSHLATSILGEEEEGHQWAFHSSNRRLGGAYLWTRMSRLSASRRSSKKRGWSSATAELSVTDGSSRWSTGSADDESAREREQELYRSPFWALLRKEVPQPESPLRKRTQRIQQMQRTRRISIDMFDAQDRAQHMSMSRTVYRPHRTSRRWTGKGTEKPTLKGAVKEVARQQRRKRLRQDETRARDWLGLMHLSVPQKDEEPLQPGTIVLVRGATRGSRTRSTVEPMRSEPLELQPRGSTSFDPQARRDVRYRRLRVWYRRRCRCRRGQ